LEIYSRGTRNILEVGLDGLLNAFARDNTNDGGGWDIRLHHFSGGEHHGYPYLFKNFTDEAVAPLADYGGGSGCGSLYLDEPGFPASDSPALYTADWGREWVFQHHLTPNGATFAADQQEFIRLPRVTDLDVDASSHLYLSSWKGATFTYTGENVGYLIRVTPKGAKPAAVPDFKSLDGSALVALLSDPSHRRRLEAQRTLLRKGLVWPQRDALQAVAANQAKPMTARVAALFALEQALGQESHAFLIDLVSDPTIREFALRALADRPEEGADVESAVFSKAVRDADPRVRLQAVRGLARLGRKDSAEAVTLCLGDADPVVAHTAVLALVDLDAYEACFSLVDQSDAPEAALVGALRALERMHEAKVVDGLISRLRSEKNPARRLGLESALARLAHREGTWKGDSWGTRPDTSGPYYQPEEWAESEKILGALKEALDNAQGEEAAGLVGVLGKNKVKLGIGLDRVLKMAQTDPGLLPAAVNQLAASESIPAVAVPLLISAATNPETTDAIRSRAVQALVHTTGEPSARAILSALVLLSEKKNQQEFLQARQAFLNSDGLGENVETWKTIAEQGDGPLSSWAEAALLEVAAGANSSPEARAVATKALDETWGTKKGRLQMLQAIRLSSDRKLAERVRLALADTDSQVVKAAQNAAKALKMDLKPRKPHTGPKIE
ncbi:MAG TPA: HEAT repeat domain-containing protein, partial [Isosphaeraceae bacterium]|nr:HEAT repeat domain-containing protein [Isosphaeraceae bacterium]